MVTVLIVKKYNRPEHSFMGVLRVIVRDEDTDPYIFVVRDTAAGSSVSGSSDIPRVSSSCTPGALALPVAELTYVVTPNRNLISIASLADLRYTPLVADKLGDLYRTDTFTVLCRSYLELEHFVRNVLSDIKTNLRLQRAHYEDVEIAVLEDIPSVVGAGLHE